MSRSLTGGPRRELRRSAAVAVLALVSWGAVATAQVLTIDLAAIDADGDPLVQRVRGSEGIGRSGVPVAGGPDVDDDGFADSAFSAFRAAPAGRTLAGKVFLVFGDGTFGEEIDTAAAPPRVLEVWGAQMNEVAGSEIWIEDVTDDGVGDLLICRQGFTLGVPSRSLAGALTIVVGGPELRTLAQMGGHIDLAAPPMGITVTTVVGATAGERLAIWARTGDVTGDGVAEIVVGADQRVRSSLAHAGAVYVIRGGDHLADGGLVDLADFGMPAPAFPLAGLVARIDGPLLAETHFGSTVQVADLDGNDRAEVLVAGQALNRSGAAFPSGHANNASPGPGSVYIFWDDAFQVAAPGASRLRPWRASDLVAEGVVGGLPFTEPWPDDFVIDGGADVSQRTVIDGDAMSGGDFGEEILGGEDYDGDGTADLFVGDLTATSVNGGSAGLGYVLFDAPSLRGRPRFAVDAPPVDLAITVVHGPLAGAIAGDTALHGDFDGDGFADVALSSPHARPFGRADAGTLHVLLGRPAPWPAVVDLAPGMLPSPAVLGIVEVHGANGTGAVPGDVGDVLAYSADAGDLDGDGRPELIVNEMAGNGVDPGTEDVGNLLLLSSEILSRLFHDGFESGDVSRWSAP